MTPEQFAKHSNSVLASVADACMETALRVTKQEEWLVRLNLVAYCNYRLCCAASRELSGPRLQRFVASSDQAVIVSLFNNAGYASDFLDSRRVGYAHADKDRLDEYAITHYFRACCGSEEVLIGYDRVVLAPEDLRFMIERFGPLPGAVAALRRADSISDPVTYRVDPLGDTEIMVTLAAAARSVFDVWQRAIHE